MKPTGDPVLDYLRALFHYIDRYRGAHLTLPPNFAAYPDEDKRIWLSNLYEIGLCNLIPTESLDDTSRLALPDPPEGVRIFIYRNGPCPPITG